MSSLVSTRVHTWKQGTRYKTVKTECVPFSKWWFIRVNRGDDSVNCLSEWVPLLHYKCIHARRERSMSTLFLTDWVPFSPTVHTLHGDTLVNKCSLCAQPQCHSLQNGDTSVNISNWMPVPLFALQVQMWHNFKRINGRQFSSFKTEWFPVLITLAITFD